MGIRPKILFDNINPKLDGGFKNIGLVDPVETKNVTPYLGGTQKPFDLSGDQWKEFSLSLSISDLLSQKQLNDFNNFLKKANSLTQIAVAFIKIIRLLTSDLFSANAVLKFVIKQIVITLKNLVNSFMATGLYYTVITPRQSENDSGFIVPTWGDFDEFKTVIIDTCTNTKDIGSPSQLNFDAQVGGFIIGGIAGSNDPQIQDELYYNAKVIFDLFGFKIPLPGPPKHLVALEGIYNENTGIKLTWNKPSHYIANGFLIFRSTDRKGVSPTEDQMSAIISSYSTAKDPNKVRDFQKIKLFDNIGIDGNPDPNLPAFIKYTFGKESYSYIDYSINPNTKYYYREYTVLKEGDQAYIEDPYLFRIDSPLSSNEASAIAYGCIPVSEISKGILTMEGDWLRKEEYRNSKWETVSLNVFFGSQIDKLLKKVENFADKLIGWVSTPSEAINDYLDFFTNKINDYIIIIQTITQIVNILLNFRLKGSMLFLDLTKPKKGGIQGFAERVSKAPVNSAIFGKKPRDESQIIKKAFGLKEGITSAVANDMGQSLAELRGIYYGLVVVYGLGNPGDIKAYAAPYMEEYNDVALQINESQKSLSMLIGIITGNWNAITK
jgi:hypothetical protein